MSRKRNLSEEEQLLWQHAMRHTKPLGPQNINILKSAPNNQPPDAAQVKEKKVKPSVKNLKSGSVQIPASLHQKPSQISSLDRRTLTRLNRGVLKIEATLDLHGYTLESAHHRLINFITSCRQRRLRYILIITGKGGRGKPGIAPVTGLLRNAVPQWLRTVPLSQHIIGINSAHQNKGGEGALYVSLRTK